MNVFAYGTLMFPEVWNRIGLTQTKSEPATLQGYTAYRLCDAVFPGIVRADDEDNVAGVLYYDLDEETLFELDAYESDLYQRSTVQVVTADGNEVECQAFVIPPSHREALTSEPWNSERFKQVELVKYLEG